jgi:hypothetical protein
MRLLSAMGLKVFFGSTMKAYVVRDSKEEER